MKPTVVNNRLEIMLGQASRQTLRLVEVSLLWVGAGKWDYSVIATMLTVRAMAGQVRPVGDTPGGENNRPCDH